MRFIYQQDTQQDEVRNLRTLLAWLGGKPNAQPREADKARALDMLNSGTSRAQLRAAIRAGIADLRDAEEAERMEAQAGASHKARAGGYSAKGAEAADARRDEEGDAAPGLPSENEAAWAPIATGHQLTSSREEREIARRYAADVAAGVARSADGTTPPMPNAAPAGEEAPEAEEAPSFPEDMTAQLGAFNLAGKLAPACPSQDDADAHGLVTLAHHRELDAKQAAALARLQEGIREAQAAARAHWLGKLYAAGVQAKAKGYTTACVAIKAAYIAVRDGAPAGELIAAARQAYKREAQGATA